MRAAMTGKPTATARGGCATCRALGPYEADEHPVGPGEVWPEQPAVPGPPTGQAAGRFRVAIGDDVNGLLGKHGAGGIHDHSAGSDQLEGGIEQPMLEGRQTARASRVEAMADLWPTPQGPEAGTRSIQQNPVEARPRKRWPATVGYHPRDVRSRLAKPSSGRCDSPRVPVGGDQ